MCQPGKECFLVTLTLCTFINRRIKNNLDCSQAAIFPCVRRSGRSPSFDVRRSAILVSQGERNRGRVQIALFFAVPPTCLRLPPSHAHFALSPAFARLVKPRWRPVELGDRLRQTHGKIGDCEQTRNSLQQWRDGVDFQ